VLVVLVVPDISLLPGQRDTRMCKTQGPPIWSSLYVTVQEPYGGRNIYGHIKSPLPGIAELSLSDDVCIPVAREVHAHVML